MSPAVREWTSERAPTAVRGRSGRSPGGVRRGCRPPATTVATILASLWSTAGPAQQPVAPPAHEFVFARLVHQSGEFGWPRWSADYPEAETHFSRGLDRLTGVDVSGHGVLIDMSDDTLFDYPWLYAVEVGGLVFSASEADNLREYLLRGGFLMIDDFHGGYEWSGFERGIRQVLPNRPIVDLDEDIEAFHVHYDLGRREQIPGIRALMSDRTWEKGGRHPQWRGIFDDDGRLMVAINFNQDIGDAWEHADDAIYPERFSSLAYRMGVNYVMYAMTH